MNTRSRVRARGNGESENADILYLHRPPIRSSSSKKAEKSDSDATQDSRGLLESSNRRTFQTYKSANTSYTETEDFHVEYSDEIYDSKDPGNISKNSPKSTYFSGIEVKKSNIGDDDAEFQISQDPFNNSTSSYGIGKSGYTGPPGNADLHSDGIKKNEKAKPKATANTKTAGEEYSHLSDGDEEEKVHRSQKSRAERNRIAKIQPIDSNRSSPQTVTKNKGKFQFSCINIVILLLITILIPVISRWTLILEILNKNQDLNVFHALKDFQDKFGKLPNIFPGQSPELWRRSQRILELHLRKEKREPAIILLTAARDAEETLRCVSNQFAKAYASSLNSSYMIVSEPNWKSEESEVVKLYIDRKLNAGFQASSRSAVLHHLEFLPPGSLLILYKYCDHENAAFKNVALILTVLLEDTTLSPDITLNELEEKVKDYFVKTFVVSETIKSYKEMDMDKLSGVWSRISHAVLPVYPEEDIVKHCEETIA